MDGRAVGAPGAVAATAQAGRAAARSAASAHWPPPLDPGHRGPLARAACARCRRAGPWQRVAAPFDRAGSTRRSGSGARQRGIRPVISTTANARAAPVCSRAGPGTQPDRARHPPAHAVPPGGDPRRDARRERPDDGHHRRHSDLVVKVHSRPRRPHGSAPGAQAAR
jgi:hypothetical protein